MSPPRTQNRAEHSGSVSHEADNKVLLRFPAESEKPKTAEVDDVKVSEFQVLRLLLLLLLGPTQTPRFCLCVRREKRTAPSPRAPGLTTTPPRNPSANVSRAAANLVQDFQVQFSPDQQDRLTLVLNVF